MLLMGTDVTTTLKVALLVESPFFNQVIWTGERYCAFGPDAVLGLRFGQRIAKGFSWFVDGRNLTDQRYAATTGVIADTRAPGAGGQNSRQFNPGLGRSVFAGLEWRM